MVAACPDLLSSDPRTRRRSEATLGLLWVAHPRGLALRRPHLLCAELAEPAAVATRMLLQVCFGLSPAEAYEVLGCAASRSDAEPLASRLCYAEMHGLPVVAAPASSATLAGGASSPPAAACGTAGAAEQAAPVQQSAAPTMARTAGLSVDELACLPQDQLLARMQKLANKASQPWPGSADFAAFAAGFAKRSEWRHLQRAAAAESARLLRLLRTTGA